MQKRDRRIALGPTGETVRANIRTLRELRGYSQTDLSQRLNAGGYQLSTNAISQIEIGARRVDVDDLMALAAAIEVTPLALLLPPVMGADVYRPVTGYPSAASMTDVWVGAVTFRSAGGGSESFGRPRTVLTTEERHSARREYLDRLIEERREELARASDSLPLSAEDSDLFSQVAKRLEARIRELETIDPADDDYWANAEHDPAPPESEAVGGEE